MLSSTKSQTSNSENTGWSQDKQDNNVGNNSQDKTSKTKTDGTKQNQTTQNTTKTSGPSGDNKTKTLPKQLAPSNSNDSPKSQDKTKTQDKTKNNGSSPSQTKYGPTDPITVGQWGPWPTTDAQLPPAFSTAAETNGAALVKTSSLSPPDFLASAPNVLYAGEEKLMAHRGLVAENKGIAENTLEAVNNASDHGVNLVEIDAQATADGIAVPLHDATLSRMMGLPGNVADTHFADIAGKPIQLLNPIYGSPGVDGSKPTYPTSSVLHSLEDEMNLALQHNPHMSFFLDPKSPAAAKAIGTIAMNDANLAKHMVLKAYPQYAQPADVTAQATTPTQKQNLALMKVMVCSDTTKVPQGWGSPQALQQVQSEIGAWGHSFEIPSFQLEGSETQSAAGFKAFSQAVQTALTVDNLPNNPKNSLGQPFKPVPGVYYQFEGFSKNGTNYRYSIKGDPIPYTKPLQSQTLGSMDKFGAWTTTDLPLEEANQWANDTIAPNSYAYNGKVGDAFLDFPNAG